MAGKILACTAACVAMASVAAAQTISLSPSVIQLKGHSGQSATQTLRLTNRTSRDLSFVLEAQDVVVDNGKRLFFGAGQITGSIAATAVFSPRSMTVPAGESRSAQVTITVPENPATRAVVAVFKGTTNNGSGTTAATASLGTLLTFTLSDVVSVRPQQTEITPPTPARNAAFAQSFLNDGAEPVTLKGVAVILNASGALVGKSAFEQKRALPRESVTLRTEYGGELRSGRYRVLLTFEYQGKSLTASGDLVVQ
jgi:hypothetical protein